MVLQSSGLITLSNVAREFLISASPIKLGETYAGGPLGVTSTLAPNVPTTAGTLIKLSQFYSAGYLAPVFSTIPTQSFNTSSTQTFATATYVTNTTRTGTLTYTISGNPSGVTINNSTGVVTIASGTASSTSSITITATGPTGLSGSSAAFSLQLSAAFTSSSINYDFRSTTTYTAGQTSVYNLTSPSTTNDIMTTYRRTATTTSGAFSTATQSALQTATNPTRLTTYAASTTVSYYYAFTSTPTTIGSSWSIEALVRVTTWTSPSTYTDSTLPDMYVGGWTNSGNFVDVRVLKSAFTGANGITYPRGAVYVYVRGVGAISAMCFTTTAQVTLNSWVHIVGTSTGLIYINGTSVSKNWFDSTTGAGGVTVTSFPSTTSLTGNKYVGWHNINGGNDIPILLGNIAAVRLHQTALTQAQVTANYNDFKSGGNVYSLP